MHLWMVAIKMGGVTEVALEVAGYRIVGVFGEGCCGNFWDKTFNS